MPSNGKPFFYQEHSDKKGRTFTIIKFKTMNDKTHENGELLPSLGCVTKVGKICKNSL